MPRSTSSRAASRPPAADNGSSPRKLERSAFKRSGLGARHTPHDAPRAALGTGKSGWMLPASQGPPRPTDESVTERAETWLLRIGWKRYGFIAPSERPRAEL